LYRDIQCNAFTGASARLANVDVRFCGLFSCVGRQDEANVEGTTIANLYPEASVVGFHGQGEIGPFGFTDEDQGGVEQQQATGPADNLPHQADIHGYSLSTIAVGLAKAHPLFPFGGAVEVFGLTSEAGQQMNGQHGIVTASVASEGRLAVLLAGAERSKAIKVTNLKSL
jgi:small ligand-binding sensory domain FIST